MVVAWDGATAHGSDPTCQPLIRQFAERRMVLRDTAFQAAAGALVTRKLCQRGAWNDRMLIETVLSMLTVIRHFKKVLHRVWE